MKDFILKENKKTKEQALWRTLAEWQEKFLNFSTNDYLGYSRHPKVVQAAEEALHKYGAGGRSSRLISGTLDLHRELEKKLAGFKGTESALLFPTGFMANLGVISSLLGEGDAILMDRLNHASLIDAAKLSRARIFVYEHASADSLEKVLKRTRAYKNRLVATDSLFSMDGDFAPLKEMTDLCGKEGVWLMIDDAHATGIFGESGVGMAEHFGVMGKIQIVMGTLSKALGSQGGFVCGPKELIDLLVNKARTFIYTTAISPPSCGAAMAALDLVGKEPQGRKKLLKLSAMLREKIAEKFPEQSDLTKLNSQIVPFLVGSAGNAMALAESLKEAGIYAPAIRPPTVPKNECRLRFSLSSEHTEDDVEHLLTVLDETPHLNPLPQGERKPFFKGSSLSLDGRGLGEGEK